METATASGVHERGVHLTPLDRESRAAIPTNEAARHLGRAPQTLRLWACMGEGPIRPTRVHGRLLWPVAEIARLVGATK
jgi:hypothetical protein